MASYSRISRGLFSILRGERCHVRPSSSTLRRRSGGIERLERRDVFAAPTLAPLPNVTIEAGAPLHIALDGFDIAGQPLTYQVSSNNPALAASIIDGNRSLRMDVANFGTMEFYLFEDEAPGTTSRIIELVRQGFYSGLTFHRVIEDFVIQGGDPDGTGAGGSGRQFDDEFDPDLRYTGVGVLGMAKHVDDSNDSQFFITDASARHLDFQHSIFGFLTAGDDVRRAITAVTVDGNDRPVTPVTLDALNVFTDQENGVLRLSAPEGATGTTTVTVTAVNSRGGATTRTFQVTVMPDTRNDTPYLLPIPQLLTPIDTPRTLTLSAFDDDGPSVQFGVIADRSKVDVQFSNGNAAVPDANGVARVTVTITPINGFTGSTPITFYAHAPGVHVPADPRRDSSFNAAADLQTQAFTVGASPSLIDLPGIYLPGESTFSLRTSQSTGDPSIEFNYGPPQSGWTPLTGDWDGNGHDTIGLYNPATGVFFLRNSNDAGAADLRFQFGPGGAGWTPVVGDWNGDGRTTVGLFHLVSSTFFLSNLNAAGAAELVYQYGAPSAGWLPLAGDWDGDGTQTVGLYNQATSFFFLRNQHAAGAADVLFQYGPPGAGRLPLAGDWDGDGTDTVGLYVPASGLFLLRNENEAGIADVSFEFGPVGQGQVPVVGDWDGTEIGLVFADGSLSPDVGSQTEIEEDQRDELFASDDLLDDLLDS